MKRFDQPLSPGARAGVTKLSAVLDARSVAIVGASADPRKLGSRPLALLQKHGFEGPLYPVNPTRAEIGGVTAYPSIRAIGKPVDLALILTAADGTVEAIEEGIACGVRGFILFASGFAEENEEGGRRQARIAQLARESGSAILGPNCVGAMNVETRLCATIASIGEVMRFEPGPISFVSQSGAIGGYLLDMALRARLGFSKWLTSGNEADISMADCIEYLADDPSTRIIGIYLEAIRDPAALRRALGHAARRGKPVLAVRSGRSAAGADAVASHTAGLAGDSQVCDAFLAQYAVQQVESLSEMVDAAKMLMWGAARRVVSPAIVSVSGGAGALVADAVCAAGLQLRPFGTEVERAVSLALPSFAKARNPLDLTGMVGADPTLLAKVLEPITRGPEHDLVLVFIGLMFGTAAGLVDALVAAANGRCPLAVIWICAPASAVEALQRQHIPVFDDIPQAVRSLRTANRAKEAMARESGLPPLEQAPRLPGAALSEAAAHGCLGLPGGIRVPREVLVRAGDDIGGAARRIGFPLAAKLQSPQVLHKTEHGAVLLGVSGEEAAAGAVKALLDIGSGLRVQCEGVLLQEMVGHELQMIVGLRWDPVFGPILVVGQGGIEVEAERDVCIRLLPVSADQIEVAIGGLRMAARLQGSRGRASIDIRALAQAIGRLCDSYLARPDICEIEINPLGVRAPAEFTALDMLVRLSLPASDIRSQG